MGESAADGAKPPASTGPGRLPHRRERPEPPAKPDLPDDEQVQLPRGVVREIERIVGRGRRADEVALALSIGSAAIDEDRGDLALPYLAWAKQEVGRSATIREAYGVALYLEQRFPEALRELQAYRRLTHSTDQNHVIADTLRALGRSTDQVGEAAAELVDDDDSPVDRRAEAAIVWASTLADAGDVSAGRAVLRRFVTRVGELTEDVRVRVEYVAADLAERDGDRSAARAHFDAVADIDRRYLDVDERRSELAE